MGNTVTAQRRDTEISAKADQQNSTTPHDQDSNAGSEGNLKKCQSLAQYEGKLEQLQKKRNERATKTTVGTAIGGAVGTAGIVTWAFLKKKATHSVAKVASSYGMCSAGLFIAGAMIAAGTCQIMHSSQMINNFGEEMENAKINFDEVDKMLDQQGSKKSSLGNEITKAFHKCVSNNKVFTEKLHDQLKKFDELREKYNKLMEKHEEEEEFCREEKFSERATKRHMANFEAGVESIQQLLLKEIESMKGQVEKIRDEYHILNQLFQMKIDQCDKMKEEMNLNTEKSSRWGWYIYGIGVACCAVMFIPGVGQAAAVGLAIASITGGVVNVALQVDACRQSDFMNKISKTKESLKRQQAVISQKEQLMQAKMEELQSIYDDLQAKFEKERKKEASSGNKFTKIDEAFTNRCAHVINEIENACESFSKEMQAVV